jgi:hypothetical protein
MRRTRKTHGQAARDTAALLLAALMAVVLCGPAAAQGRPDCTAARVAGAALGARVYADYVVERCATGERLGAVVLWRGAAGWATSPSRDTALARAAADHRAALEDSARRADAVFGGGQAGRLLRTVRADERSGRITLTLRDVLNRGGGRSPSRFTTGTRLMASIPAAESGSAMVVFVDHADAVGGPPVLLARRSRGGHPAPARRRSRRGGVPRVTRPARLPVEETVHDTPPLPGALNRSCR